MDLLDMDLFSIIRTLYTDYFQPFHLL
jgi:hypothetical protein